LLSILILAAESAPPLTAGRPACTAAIAGEFWPEQANKDHKLAAKLARCGQLQMCTRGYLRYRWNSPTIRLDQLSKHSGRPIPAECGDGQRGEASPASSPARK
jgi:hypothetical protein